MKVLVTGSAGFIGSALTIKLLDRGDEVIGIDNHNDYYDPSLKELRLDRHVNHPNYTHLRMSIENREKIQETFKDNEFECVVNLAAQAGVRYSIENPLTYIDTNLVGFANILEGCRHNKIKHLVYASSSSVYGMNYKQPFSTNDRVDYPISFYAATKKSNELMAYSYSHLYKIPTTGLRFFTVYGPYGRPDMAYFKFTRSILDNKPINVYNNGNLKRDFTYIDDIVSGVIRTIKTIPEDSPNHYSSSLAPYKIYNIGNNNPVTLRRFISAIESACKKKAIKNYMPMQPGDVKVTYADIDNFTHDVGFKPTISIEEGMARFVKWFKR